MHFSCLFFSRSSVSGRPQQFTLIVDQPVEDEPMTAVHSDLDSAAAQQRLENLFSMKVSVCII